MVPKKKVVKGTDGQKTLHLEIAQCLRSFVNIYIKFNFLKFHPILLTTFLHYAIKLLLGVKSYFSVTLQDVSQFLLHIMEFGYEESILYDERGNSLMVEFCVNPFRNALPPLDTHPLLYLNEANVLNASFHFASNEKLAVALFLLREAFRNSTFSSSFVQRFPNFLTDVWSLLPSDYVKNIDKA